MWTQKYLGVTLAPLQPQLCNKPLQGDLVLELQDNGSATAALSKVDIEGETAGLSTYMRTDGTNISKEAIDDFRKFVHDDYGDKYLPEAPNSYTGKSQERAEAHEAIRPANISRKPSDIKKYVNADQFKLYELIWSRHVISNDPGRVW